MLFRSSKVWKNLRPVEWLRHIQQGGGARRTDPRRIAVKDNGHLATRVAGERRLIPR